MAHRPWVGHHAGQTSPEKSHHSVPRGPLGTAAATHCCPVSAAMAREQRATHLCVSQLNRGEALVGFFYTCHIVLARAVLRVSPVQSVLLTGQHGVEI